MATAKTGPFQKVCAAAEGDMNMIQTLAAVILAAGPQCFPAQVLYGTLEKEYSEVRTHTGRMGQIVIEIWSNAEKQTFSIVVAKPDGTACLMLSGGEWEVATPQRPKPNI